MPGPSLPDALSWLLRALRPCLDPFFFSYRGSPAHGSGLEVTHGPTAGPFLLFFFALFLLLQEVFWRAASFDRPIRKSVSGVPE